MPELPFEHVFRYFVVHRKHRNIAPRLGRQVPPPDADARRPHSPYKGAAGGTADTHTLSLEKRERSSPLLS